MFALFKTLFTVIWQKENRNAKKNPKKKHICFCFLVCMSVWAQVTDFDLGTHFFENMIFSTSGISRYVFHCFIFLDVLGPFLSIFAAIFRCFISVNKLQITPFDQIFENMIFWLYLRTVLFSFLQILMFQCHFTIYWKRDSSKDSYCGVE